VSNSSVAPETVFTDARNGPELSTVWVLRYKSGYLAPGEFKVQRVDIPFPFNLNTTHVVLGDQRSELGAEDYSTFYGVLGNPVIYPRVTNINTSCTPEHIYITKGYSYSTKNAQGRSNAVNPDYWDFWGYIGPDDPWWDGPTGRQERFQILSLNSGYDIRYDVITIRVSLPRTGSPGGELEYKRSSISLGNLNRNVFDQNRERRQHFFDSMYDGDPLKAITKVRQSESSNWDADILNWDPQELWPSTLSYNSQTGLARAIVQKSDIVNAKNFVTFERTLPTDLTSREVATLITAARPFTFDAYNNPNSGFTAVSDMEGVASAGILYDEIYPLNSTRIG
jgi:hypothetical protein